MFAGLSAQLMCGDVLQVVGANGSGKTSLLGILNTSLAPLSGELLFLGQPVTRSLWRYRRSILFIGHQAGIKLSLTPRENLRWLADIHPSRTDCTIADALSLAGLDGLENTPCHSLSAGQLRRVALARLRRSAAPLWLLDEPLTSIDATGVAELEALFSQHAKDGGSVVLTSHQELRLPGVKRLEIGGGYYAGG